MWLGMSWTSSVEPWPATAGLLRELPTCIGDGSKRLPDEGVRGRGTTVGASHLRPRDAWVPCGSRHVSARALGAARLDRRARRTALDQGGSRPHVVAADVPTVAAAHEPWAEIARQMDA